MNNLWKPEGIPQPKVRAVKPPKRGPDRSICEPCQHKGKCVMPGCPPVDQGNKVSPLEQEYEFLKKSYHQATGEYLIVKNQSECLLSACQSAYRKHCLGDDSIGWDELSEILKDALCNTMGDDEFCKWLDRKDLS